MKKIYQSALTLFVMMSFSCSKQGSSEIFISDFPRSVQRIWIGPAYWANPMQDWQLDNGRLICTVLGRDRNVHLLTRKIGKETESFKLSVNIGVIEKSEKKADWVGLKLGATGEFEDYRSDAVFGQGVNMGTTMDGGVFLGDVSRADYKENLAVEDVLDDFTFEVVGTKQGDAYALHIAIIDEDVVSKLDTVIAADKLVGDIALVSHFDPGKRGTQATRLRKSAWFKNIRVEGKNLGTHDEYAFGPILFAQHTLSEKTLKLTAQLPPVGQQDGQTVVLSVEHDQKWQQVAESPIDKNARTATFKVQHWPDSADQQYRLTYEYIGKNDQLLKDTFYGTIRKNPVDKPTLVVAGFTGNNDLGFPNDDVVANVLKQKPDVLFFSGDQIYEPVGGYGNIQQPLNKAIVDYLRKWIMYGWEYRELLRNIPTVSIPDDHDVYHGNVWGEGGKKAKETGSEKERQDSGGYKMPASFVNVVQRTQTSNLPDPYDPTPVKQGIGVYYTRMNYGGLSFAIVEDRKFKSSPANLLPAEAAVSNGWAENKNFDVRYKSDVPGAVLLGERQEKFLSYWASDWQPQTDMKVLLSQTIFNNVATLPAEAVSDVVVSKLRIMHKGDYPDDDVIVADMDSDGWPHTARNRAVDIIRRCFAFHIAGDQHLGSTIHYGVDTWRDAGAAVCVPSISNYFPRRWYPSTAGLHRRAGAPKNTGDFMDGFNNYLTVYAVSNPVFTGKKPSKLHDRAAGYGIVKFDKETRDINIELWPRDGDPASPSAKPYDGWPVVINQMENYGREAYGYLPEIVTTGLKRPPVVQVIAENGEIVYTVRARNNHFRPKVFAPGNYRVRIGELALGKEKILQNLLPSADTTKTIAVKF